MADVEPMDCKPDTLSLQRPRSGNAPKMEDVQKTRSSSTEILVLTASAGGCNRGKVTIIYNGKSGSQMHWTFPLSYLERRSRSFSQHIKKSIAELNASNFQGTFTPEALTAFYDAITKESTVPSDSHSLHEYCQIYCLAQFFGVYNIFQDDEGQPLRKVMGDDTGLETIKMASGLASVFKWRALVERCRFLLARRITLLKSDLEIMNCVGLNVLASKLNEVDARMYAHRP